MLIFCQNTLISPAYLEILTEFNPVLITQKEDLKKFLSPKELLIIDEDNDLFEKLSQDDDSPALLFISKNFTENDSFIQKPISAQKLLQKVNILIQRQQKGLLMNFTINGFTFNGQSRSINGILLTQKEAELIELL